MSIRVAIEIIKHKLPPELQRSVANVLESDKSKSEVQIPFFGITRVPSLEGIKHTSERRLIGCENPIKEKCLREKLAFLNKSFDAGSIQQDLWMGYFVPSESEKNFFLIDTKQKTLWVGPYP